LGSFCKLLSLAINCCLRRIAAMGLRKKGFPAARRRADWSGAASILFSLLLVGRFADLTPGPPPFSSMNSSPCHLQSPATSRLILTQPDARTAAIARDELDAGGFEGATDCSVIWRGQGSLVFAKLSAPDRCDPYLRLPSQVFRTPTEKRACGPDLTAREGLHELTLNDMWNIIQSPEYHTVIAVSERISRFGGSYEISLSHKWSS
jgi:hypothetical protein